MSVCLSVSQAVCLSVCFIVVSLVGQVQAGHERPHQGGGAGSAQGILSC